MTDSFPLPYTSILAPAIALLLGLAAPTAHAQIYVDANNTSGTQDGTSWSTAYANLQNALDGAGSSDEIWIAEGVYYPDQGAGIPDAKEDTSFVITGAEDGLAVYGGFAGSETNRSARDPAANPTVLSGDIDDNDANKTASGVTPTAADLNGNNSNHVVYLDGTGTDNLTGSTVIDGVTITAGEGSFAAGLYCDGSGSGNECSPSLKTIKFAGNKSQAIWNDGSADGKSSPTITDATFVGNASSFDGGALYNNGQEGVSSPTITNATFADNEATDFGGGIYSTGEDGGESSPTIVNAVFVNNTSGGFGGGLYFGAQSSGTSKPTITNTTFTDNSASSGGGAIYISGYNTSEGNVRIRNSILWGNSGSDSGDEVRNFQSTVSVSHTIFRGGVGGSEYEGGISANINNNGGNLDRDPQFVDASTPEGPDGTYGTGDDGLRLFAISPATDAGSNTLVSVSTDLTGATRTQDNNLDGTPTVNMGPYEEVRDEARTLRVDADATGERDGSSWSNAFSSFQFALRTATNNDEIWVAEGVYTPNSEGEPFTIYGAKDGLQVYGGFDGTETSRSARDPAANPTVLSGDLNGDDIKTASGATPTASNIVGGENAHHVLLFNGGDQVGTGIGPNITDATVVDGLTISAGQADGSGAATDGGGVYCDGAGSGNECSPTLKRMVFAGNASADGGGALYNDGSDGGTSNATVVNAAFVGNEASAGGALYNDGRNSGTSSPQVVSATLNENTATSGGSFYNDGSNSGTSSPQVTNTILWGNSGTEMYNDGATPVLAHTIIEGGLSGISENNGSSTTDDGGNLDQDPRFVAVNNPEGGDGRLGTDDDGLQVTASSPALDAGTDGPYQPGGVAENVSTDLVGAARIQDQDGNGTATANVGAYEGVADDPEVLRVDASAVGPADGSSWTDAFSSLQEALNAAAANDEIWVAEGVYTPDSEDEPFTISGAQNGLQIYGGFDGTETSRSARDPAANPTVLSGDIDDNDANKTASGVTPTASDISGGENAHHVLVFNGGDAVGSSMESNVTDATVLDGVTVTAGQADGSGGDTDGGGVYCDGAGSGNTCNPQIRNVTVTGNAADGVGGGLYNDGNDGGTTNSEITRSVFTGNTATSGGALYNDGQSSGRSSPQVTTVTFTSNTASSDGGAIYNDSRDGGVSSPRVTNTLFSTNTASSGGGMMNDAGSNGDSSPHIINSTFTRNSASSGGAIYNDWTFRNSESSPRITNSILWGNSEDEVYSNRVDGATPVASHSIVQGKLESTDSNGFPDKNFVEDGGGNLNADPRFAYSPNPAGADGIIGTGDDGLRVRAGSPALDAGDDGAVPSGISEDVTGATRTQNGTVDIGAYEGPVSDKARTIYVDTSASGTGLSWDNALSSLQLAFNAATGNDEIWIAEGVYTPDSEGGSFTVTGLQDGLAVYGGFDGTETSRSARDPGANPTVLSGDINGDDNNKTASGVTPTASDISGGENANHVLVFNGGNQIGSNVEPNVTDATVLDGVTVTAGQADGSKSNGGGLFCDGNGDGNECAPQIRNVVFAGNEAVGQFSAYGGAIFLRAAGPTIINSTFTSNTAGQGGAIGRFTGDVHIVNCTFTDNSGNYGGGAIWSLDIDSIPPELDNDSTPQIINSILWANTSSNGAGEIDDPSLSLSHTIIEGGINGSKVDGNVTDDGGNLDQDPQFVDASAPSGPDGVVATRDDGVNVQSSSPALDAGTNAPFETGGDAETVSTDLTGSARIQDRDGNGTATVNIGAYEVGAPAPPTATTEPSSEVGATSATLAGTVNPGGAETTVTFKYRPVGASSFTSTEARETPLTGSSDQSVTATVSGLQPATDYKVKVTASNSEGTDDGSLQTFTTEVGVSLTSGGAAGLNRSFSATPGAANQPVGVLRLTPGQTGVDLTEVDITPDNANVPGVDRVGLWVSTDDAFIAAGDTKLETLDLDPQTALPSTLTFESFTKSLPGSARYLFVTVTLTNSAQGQLTGVLTDETAFGLNGGAITEVNGNSQSTFSALPLSAESAPLPVEMAGFDGAVTEDGVQLRWKTASEQNNAGFRVLRTNGADEDPAGEWTRIGFVEGTGTTNDAQGYRFTDTDLPYDADSVSYRLEQVDTDGTERLTDPVTVARGGPDQLELLNTAPNPARRRATVRFAIPEGTDAEAVEMRLYDVLGRQVRTVETRVEPGRHKQRLDVRNLSSGVYFLRLQAGGATTTQRMTVVQ